VLLALLPRQRTDDFMTHCDGKLLAFPPGSLARFGGHGDDPEWVQIANILLECIASGDLRPGDVAGTRDALSQEFGCTGCTALQALNALEARGLLRGFPRKGHVVVLPPAPPGDEDPARPAMIGQVGDPRDWVRVANAVLARIAAGTYASQPVRAIELAAEFGFCRSTAGRALTELVTLGILELLPGKGYFVRHDGDRR
jgi:DNA-binding GntR family transcriptional regulator